MKHRENVRISSGPKQNTGRLVRCLAPALLAAVIATGCHKAPDAPPPPPAPPPAPAAPQTTEAAPQAPTGPPPPNVNYQQTQNPADPNYESPVKSNGEPDLHTLDHSILRWRFDHGRKPSSFAEFAASADVQIPKPPPGKMYALSNTGHVVLVNAKQ